MKVTYDGCGTHAVAFAWPLAEPAVCTDGVRCMRTGCEHEPDGTYLRGYRP